MAAPQADLATALAVFGIATALIGSFFGFSRLVRSIMKPEILSLKDMEMKFEKMALRVESLEKDSGEHRIRIDHILDTLRRIESEIAEQGKNILAIVKHLNCQEKK